MLLRQEVPEHCPPAGLYLVERNSTFFTEKMPILIIQITPDGYWTTDAGRDIGRKWNSNEIRTRVRSITGPLHQLFDLITYLDTSEEV
jgi:hypothetical protein